MKAIDVIRNALQFTASMSPRYFEDMRDAPLTQPTPRGGNHPLWVLGHLAYSEAGIGSMIGGDANPWEKWATLFQPGSQPTTDVSAYPPYDQVLAAYLEQRERTMKLLDEVGDAGLDDAPLNVPDEMKAMFPTKAEVFMLIVVHHEFHMGQVADARRAIGRDPLMKMPEAAEA